MHIGGTGAAGNDDCSTCKLLAGVVLNGSGVVGAELIEVILQQFGAATGGAGFPVHQP